MIVRLYEQALHDIDSAAQWYDQQEAGLGNEFVAEVDQHLAALVAQPEIWPLWPNVSHGRYPVRRRLLTRFPYAFAYQVLNQTVVVLAVAAHKRKPQYWSERIQR